MTKQAKQATGNGEERKETLYPYYDLESSIHFAENIKQLGGSREGVKKSLLARQLGIAESTPSFFQKISAAKVFGIIQGWGTYALTDVGRNYFYPQSEEAQRNALFTMLATPKAFSFILKRFDGEQLPLTGILGNILHQELGITESWKDRVSQAFNRSAHFVGIIDNNDFLRYGAGMHTTTKTGVSESQPAQSKPPLKSIDPMSVPAELIATDEASPGISAWSYAHKGKQIKVQTPEDLSKELWDKLNAYVQVLKPSDETTP